MYCATWAGISDCKMLSDYLLCKRTQSSSICAAQIGISLKSFKQHGSYWKQHTAAAFCSRLMFSTEAEHTTIRMTHEAHCISPLSPFSRPAPLSYCHGWGPSRNILLLKRGKRYVHMSFSLSVSTGSAVAKHTDVVVPGIKVMGLSKINSFVPRETLQPQTHSDHTTLCALVVVLFLYGFLL